MGECTHRLITLSGRMICKEVFEVMIHIIGDIRKYIKVHVPDMEVRLTGRVRTPLFSVTQQVSTYNTQETKCF